MADFCQQCSIELFGEDFKELAGFTTEADTLRGLFTSPLICEGCGVIQVDHLGRCVSPDCDKKHGAIK